MFAFAITTTGILYVYWKLHIGPYLPLQRALATEFRGSRPRVEGGQRKIHKGTPRILRVTMKVAFDPLADEPHARAFADRVDEFVRKNYDLAPYDLLEVHFYWPDPEKKIHEWSQERPVAAPVLRLESSAGRAMLRSRSFSHCADAQRATGPRRGSPDCSGGFFSEVRPMHATSRRSPW